VAPSSAADGPSRAPFTAEIAELIEPFAPPVVSFHFGLPAPALVQRVKGWGAKVLSSATTVEEARQLEARGVDVIIAQGLEAGGHRGMFLTEDLDTQLGTLALVPQIVAAVRVPVVAAGGIADAAGAAAARALGAVAVQVGTAYLLCPEATTRPLHRAALARAAERPTAVTNVFSGRPARGLVNRAIAELGPMSPLAPPFPLAADGVAPLRAAAERQGSDAFTSLWCGQNPSGCKAVPAAEITRAIAAGLV
jgi:nitronate monooxygenase